ncbi:LysE family transporter [Desulfovibrio inopinatus]|uniref:LysE family transporter n=1 Tax=Desulfovibrio inopinatus TaxID=102109 RepID=UPI000424FA0E|nr:LysE family transporter [Desulfovibrio inopinatus]
MMFSIVSTAVVAGAALGLSAGIAPGPMFSLVLAQTLAHNLREGLKVAVAPLLTDGPIIVLSLCFMTAIAEHPTLLGAISLAGAAMLVHYGLDCLRFAGVDAETPQATPGSLKKAIIVNLLNPHPYMFWALVGAPMLVKSAEHGFAGPIAFLVAFYTCIVLAKSGLACIAARFKHVLRSSGYLLVMRVLGVSLFVFAFLFARDGLKAFGVDF